MHTLYLDIENTPNLAHVWELWNTNVSLSQLRESSRIMCFAARWRGEKTTKFYSERHGDHEGMIRAAHDLLSEADVVVTYNGKRFDIPTLNREFVELGLPAPAPFAQVDLFQTVKKQFRFPSNKLDYVAQKLGIAGKVKHEGHMLWVRCMAGEEAAWDKMKRYNCRDVGILVELHDKLMSWVVGAPNARLIDGDVCPVCGSGELRREGYANLLTGRYQRWQCRDCGAWSRSTRREDGTEIRSVF